MRTGIVREYNRDMGSLNEQVRAKILEVIFRHLRADEWDVYLYGSFARGTADTASDVDLAVRGPRMLAPATAARIVADLEDEVPLLREFDLIDLNQVPGELRAKVLREGIRWNRATTER